MLCFAVAVTVANAISTTIVVVLKYQFNVSLIGDNVRVVVEVKKKRA